MIKALYNWTIERAAHPNALWFLALISFVESSIFPLPPDFFDHSYGFGAPQTGVVNSHKLRRLRRFLGGFLAM